MYIAYFFVFHQPKSMNRFYILAVVNNAARSTKVFLRHIMKEPIYIKYYDDWLMFLFCSGPPRLTESQTMAKSLVVFGTWSSVCGCISIRKAGICCLFLLSWINQAQLLVSKIQQPFFSSPYLNLTLAELNRILAGVLRMKATVKSIESNL